MFSSIEIIKWKVNQMKGLYIAPVDSSIKEHLGIHTKIMGQINALTNLGIKMDYIRMKNDYIVFKEVQTDIKLNRAKHYLFFRYIISNIEDLVRDYDFVYIRFSFANPYMFKLAKILKNKGIKVFIEIPTYPYESELVNTLKNKVLKIVDRILWKVNKGNVYKLVLTTNKKELFGIKCINIFNGIDVNNLHKVEGNNRDNIIRLIAVANISRWHGYDRVINGLSKYYLRDNEKKEVEFYLIGEGEEKENLEKLTRDLNCDKYVKFLGAKHGKELDNIFNHMDIGVSSLALFRAGGGHDPIKSKEYVGRGLPVILGYKDMALDETLEFVFNVSEDESDLDIEEIVKKYCAMNYTVDEIRNYAEKNLSWNSQMKKIVDEIIKIQKE